MNYNEFIANSNMKKVHFGKEAYYGKLRNFSAY